MSGSGTRHSGTRRWRSTSGGWQRAAPKLSGQRLAIDDPLGARVPDDRDLDSGVGACRDGRARLRLFATTGGRRSRRWWPSPHVPGGSRAAEETSAGRRTCSTGSTAVKLMEPETHGPATRTVPDNRRVAEAGAQHAVAAADGLRHADSPQRVARRTRSAERP